MGLAPYGYPSEGGHGDGERSALTSNLKRMHGDALIVSGTRVVLRVKELEFNIQWKVRLMWAD